MKKLRQLRLCESCARWLVDGGVRLSRGKDPEPWKPKFPCSECGETGWHKVYWTVPRREGGDK